MSIDVCRGAEIGVTEPILNLLKRYTVGQKQTGTAMAQIVEAYLFQAMLLKILGEIACQVIRRHPLAQLIHKYIPVVLVVVAVAADLFVELLGFFTSRK